MKTTLSAIALVSGVILSTSAFAIDTISFSAPSGTLIAPASGQNFTNGKITVNLSASSSDGHNITAWNVYVDSVSQYKAGQVPSISTSICIPAGTHTVKITAWDGGGTLNSYVASSVMVTGTCSATIPISPSAVVSHNLDRMCTYVSSTSCSNGWKSEQDANGGGTGVSTSSTTSLTSSMPARTGEPDAQARLFNFIYSGGWADERYSVQIPATDGGTTPAVDTTSTNFVYDTWIYVDHPEELYALEFDMNQGVVSGGTEYVVVFGIQCNLSKNVWQYTSSGVRVDTNVTCPRTTWTANTWHHLQLYYQRDGLKSVFNAVSIDNNYQAFLTSTGAHPEATNYHAMSWQPGVMVLNYQIDSLGSSFTSGTVKSYLDTLTLYRW